MKPFGIVGSCTSCGKEKMLTAKHCCSPCYSNQLMLSKLPKEKERDLVECMLCHQKMFVVGRDHLNAVHNITTEQYKERFPGVVRHKILLGFDAVIAKNPEDFKKKSPERLKYMHKRYRERDPEGYKKRQSLAGKEGSKYLVAWRREHPWMAKEVYKINIKKNPDLHIKAKKGLEKFRTINPDFYKNLGKKRAGEMRIRMSETMKRWHKMKTENPEEYEKWKKSATAHSDGRYLREYYDKYPDARKHTIEIVKKRKPDHYKNMGKKLVEFNKEHPENLVKAAHASQKARIENSPHHWNGGKFSNWEEMEVAKLLLDKPLDGINTQIKVGKIKIDYYPKQKVFVEYHPWHHPSNKISKKGYESERINEIEKSKYKGTPLVVIKHGFRDEKERLLQQVKEIKEKYQL